MLKVAIRIVSFPRAGGEVLAVGDAHIVNDPVLGQGANLASRCAWMLGEALLGIRDQVVIATKLLHRLDENLGAASVELTANDLSDIVAVISQVQVQGDRYPAHLQQRVGR